jgi:hypothetical protein
MTWNAYACRQVPDPFFSGQNKLMLVPLADTDELLATFRAASLRVQEKDAGVELSLEHGGLTCRASARALEIATKEVRYGSEWSPDKVKDLAAHANWSFSVHEDDMACKLSAEAFLSVCAEHNLGIRFD